MTKLEKKLLEKNWITGLQFLKAKEEAQKLKKSFYAAIIKLGYLTEEDIFTFFSQETRIPLVNISEYKLNPELLRLFPEEFYRENLFVPLFKIENNLYLGMMNPLNTELIERVEKETNSTVIPLFSSPSAILKALDNFFGPKDYYVDLEDLTISSSRLSFPFYRDSERVKVNLPVEIKPVDKNIELVTSSYIPATCVDISENAEAIGVRIFIYFPSKIRLLIKFPSQEEIEGEVVHCTVKEKGYYLLGIKFFEKQKEFLEKFLKEKNLTFLKEDGML